MDNTNEGNEVLNDDEEQANRIEAYSFFSDMMGKSTETALLAMNKKNKMENVAIFVDYDNVYWTLMNNYSHDPNDSNPTKNLFDRLWSRYGQEHVRTFRSYADFEKIKTQLTSLQKREFKLDMYTQMGKMEITRKIRQILNYALTLLKIHIRIQASLAMYL